MDTPPPVTRISREMGYSLRDFLHTLHLFMADAPYTRSGAHIHIPEPKRQVDIYLGEEAERRIGPTIRLPYLPVEMVFTGYSEQERKAFFRRFEQVFHRGGG